MVVIGKKRMQEHISGVYQYRYQVQLYIVHTERNIQTTTVHIYDMTSGLSALCATSYKYEATHFKHNAHGAQLQPFH
jgi:hypothetical protein